MKKLIILSSLILFLVIGAAALGLGYIMHLRSQLPQIMKIEDYQPPLVTTVHSKNGKRIGEFFIENRILVPYEKMPKKLINAFLAAEDDSFFQHKGINFQAIVRAMLANLRAGRTAQGASTITMQVAKSFFLSPKKELSRKIKEAILAIELEKNLGKEDILYLYLNQIFFGEQSYGVAAAAQTYFHKNLDELTLAECALLAGLPKAPSRYSPVTHPHEAKNRQSYVLRRMADVGFVSKEEAEKAAHESVKIYYKNKEREVAPEFVESIRQLLVDELGEETILQKGLKIETSLDLNMQRKAQESVRQGLKALDKRQGYRGPLRHIDINQNNGKEHKDFLLATRNKLITDLRDYFYIRPNTKLTAIKGYKPGSDKEGNSASGATGSANGSGGEDEQADSEATSPSGTTGETTAATATSESPDHSSTMTAQYDDLDEPRVSVSSPWETYPKHLKSENDGRDRSRLAGSNKQRRGNASVESKTADIPITLPEYLAIGDTTEGIVSKIDDQLGIVYVRVAETQGLINIEDMGWARKPNARINSDYAPKIKKPSEALKVGDVIQVQVMAPHFKARRLSAQLLPNADDYLQLNLEQEPQVEGALLSIDEQTEDILAMVGGYNFDRSKFNRSIQAGRQTGSSFKALIYLSALDKGWTASRTVADAPIVYEESLSSEAAEGQDVDGRGHQANAMSLLRGGDAGGSADGSNTQKDGDAQLSAQSLLLGKGKKTWKPHNYGNRFEGDVLFRTALIQSLNIPTVKILQDVGIGWSIDYARRLGLFSPLNNDLSLSLGSSDVTLYEMTKAFATLGRLGKRTRPIIVRRILDKSGQVIRENVSLDLRFKKELEELNKSFAEKRSALNANQLPQILDRLRKSGAPNLAQELRDVDGIEDLIELEMKLEVKAKQGSSEANIALNTLRSEMKNVPRLFFKDPDQLIRPATAYVLTQLLTATITDGNGTGARARALERPVAGKTGTTSNYVDTWFIGFTPNVATGVWVGYDQVKSLGVGEAGGRTAIPIWLGAMKEAHRERPVQNFKIPESIVLAHIDKETGKLASSSSKEVVTQAFVTGTEPTEISGDTRTKDQSDFYKEDLAE